jgi:predicted dinucleotide-utilizing enzyme
MKPLAFAADAGELIFVYGFSMAVSSFDRLRSARSQIVEKCRYSTAKPVIAQNTNLVAEKIAVPRTRGSVRRASGFVQIAISPTTRMGGVNLAFEN